MYNIYNLHIVCTCPKKNITATLKKNKKTKSKNNLNQEGLHKWVTGVEINLENFSQRVIQIACIRSSVKIKIIIGIQYSSDIL